MKFFRRKNIYRSGNNGSELYMIRWNLFSCKWFSIKIHKVLISDEDDLHDHPFSFLTLILWGGYHEEVFFKDSLMDLPRMRSIRVNPCVHHQNSDIKPGEVKRGTITKYWRRPGSILWRPAEFAHRLIIDKPCWTFVIATRKFRPWGFWGKNGWTFFEKYDSTQVCD